MFCDDVGDCPGGVSCDVVTSQYEITLNLIPPISLEKNKRNWLAIRPVQPFVGFYQTAWVVSDKFNGEPAQQYFGMPWVPVNACNPCYDMAFEMIGAKTCIAQSDCLDADICTCDTCDPDAGVCAHRPTTYGNVDCDPMDFVNLADILCVLDGFEDVALCPHADIAGCEENGTIDLDDILSVIAAFGGADPCCGGRN